jgi:hypothetical protein
VDSTSHSSENDSFLDSASASVDEEQTLEDRKQQKISTTNSSFVKNDIDYEIFPIEDSEYCVPNRVSLPTAKDATQNHVLVRRIAQELAERQVWIASGTTGTVRGTMQASTHFIKMAGNQTFQEIWAVQLERDTGKSSIQVHVGPRSDCFDV